MAQPYSSSTYTSTTGAGMPPPVTSASAVPVATTGGRGSTAVRTSANPARRRSTGGNVGVALLDIFIPPLGVAAGTGNITETVINVGFWILGAWIGGVIHAGIVTFSDARLSRTCGINDPPHAPLDRPGYAAGATGGTMATSSTATTTTTTQPMLGAGGGMGGGYQQQQQPLLATQQQPLPLGAIAPVQQQPVSTMGAAPIAAAAPVGLAKPAPPVPTTGIPLGAVAGGQQLAGQPTGQPSGAALGGAALGAAAGIGAAEMGMGKQQVWSGPPQQVSTGQPLVAGSSGTQGVASASLTSLEAARAVSPL